MSQKKFSLKAGGDRIVGVLDRPRTKHWTPVFLFLHGQTSTKEDTLAQHLAQQLVRQGIAVCRIDFPGHGESSGTIDRYTYSRCLKATEATLNWLHRQGFRRFAVGGHSLGGAMSYLLASRVPGLRSIISLSGVTDPWRVHRSLYSAQALRNLARRGYADRLTSDGKPFRQSLAFFRDLERYRDFSSVARDIHCPTLVIQGTKDTVVTLSQVRQFFKQLTGVGEEIKALVPLTGVGHDFRSPAVRDAVSHLIGRWLPQYFADETPVVDVFVFHKGKLLLVKRSQRVGAFRGFWHVPAGFLPPGKNVVEHAREEISEELGLRKSDILSARTGQVVRRVDETVQRIWVVHPVIVQSATKKIRLNWEHDAARWVTLRELSQYRFIPGVKKALERNWPV